MSNYPTSVDRYSEALDLVADGRARDGTLYEVRRDGALVLQTGNFDEARAHVREHGGTLRNTLHPYERWNEARRGWMSR